MVSTEKIAVAALTFFYFEEGKCKRPILSLQTKLPLANGQYLSIEGLEKGSYLYVRRVYTHNFPRRKKT